MTRQRVVVLGLDLSLRQPAAVVIPNNWKVGEWRTLARWSQATEPPADDRGRYERLADIVDCLTAFALRHEVTDAFVEAYAFSRHSSSVTGLAELGGHARVEFLRRLNLVLRPVPASQARRQLLGALPPKDAKVIAQQAVWRAGAPFANGDEVDAFVVSNFGLTECGLTALSLA